MYKIDKTTPPPTDTRKGHFTKYPFGQLEIGHSFDAPASESGRVSRAAYAYGRSHGLKFSARTIGDSVKVWRIK